MNYEGGGEKEREIKQNKETDKEKVKKDRERNVSKNLLWEHLGVLKVKNKKKSKQKSVKQ